MQSASGLIYKAQSVLSHYDRAYAGDYTKRQLAYAGTKSELFTEKTVDRIHEYSSAMGQFLL